MAAAARHVLLPHDYLSFRLTGTMTTDRSDVSGTGWWSPADESYAADVLELDAVRLDPGYLPEVLGPTAAAGTVTKVAAEQFGLRPGAPVACGAGDNAAGALALSFAPGEAALSLGTSGTVYAPSARPSADSTGTVAGFASADGRYLPLACTLNATVAVDQVSEWLGLGREDVASAGEVVFLPWLGGERTPNAPSASGTLTGLRYSTDKRAILQAAYDGLVATLLEATAFLDQWAPQSPEAPLLLLGGGARGRAWQETVRRLSGRPVLVVELSELVAYGAAVQAAALLTGEPLAEVANRWGARRGRPARARGARRRGTGPHRRVAPVVPRHLVQLIRPRPRQRIDGGDLRPLERQRRQPGHGRGQVAGGSAGRDLPPPRRRRVRAGQAPHVRSPCWPKR